MGIVIERALDFLIEEEDESNIFPKAEEAQELEETSEPDEQTETSAFQEPEVILRSFIPQSEKDWEIGWKQLTEADYETYQVPKNRLLYRTMEEMTRNCLKISASLGGRYLKEIQKFFPPGYLRDREGYTPMSVVEMRQRMRYTCTKRFPNEPNGEINWSKYKRGDLNQFGIDNPDYHQRFKYWDLLAQRWRDYQAVMEPYKRKVSMNSYVYVGEFVEEEDPLIAEQRISDAKAQIELLARRPFTWLDDYSTKVKTLLVQEAYNRGLDARIAAEVAHNQAIEQQPDIEEDL
ncbi:MAG TPA: hypothetical protein DCL61_05005 [Cyanobacteria bacterium UBA12227]|nr:hypothetical protein [Cyanobacteria bacterium UBA12227]HAX84760.1 hypothetical protein [Cyanobacteria bacterium UBA11370]HBY81568.1 hypothetical protein [Cyanobacteria bacterium UBA11148]